MKFDFNSTKYVQMFEKSVEGRSIISYILNDPDLIRANYQFWKSVFPADPSLLVTSNAGHAAVVVESREPEHATMADWRAPLGLGRQLEEGQSVQYNAGIIDLIAPSWQEQAMEREAKLRTFEDLGDDAPLILGYATQVLQPRVDSINMALSNMSAQALSTGRVSYRNGRGIMSDIYTSPIPAENKVTAGKLAWDDKDCDILEQMVEIETHFKEDVWGREDMSLEWNIDYSTYKNIFMKNAKIIEWIKTCWLVSQGQLISQIDSVPNAVVDDATFAKYISTYPGLSPIRVIKEHQKDGDKIVHGWKDGIAVLRPTGYAGKTYKTEILDKVLYEKYGNSIINKVFGTTADGLITVINTTGINGTYKYWATDVVASATPVLETFLYQVLVSFKEADA